MANSVNMFDILSDDNDMQITNTHTRQDVPIQVHINQFNQYNNCHRPSSATLANTSQSRQHVRQQVKSNTHVQKQTHAQTKQHHSRVKQQNKKVYQQKKQEKSSSRITTTSSVSTSSSASTNDISNSVTKKKVENRQAIRLEKRISEKELKKQEKKDTPPQSNPNAIALKKYMPVILEIIRKYSETIIAAPTGSGKTVLTAAEIATAMQVMGEIARIVVTIPTIAATVSCTAYVKKLYPNLKIGYAADGEVHYNDRTEVIFCTTAHLKNFILRNVTLKNITHIIVDEAHVPGIENEKLLLMLANDILTCREVFHADNLKLILTSATLNIAKWVSKFPNAGTFEIADRGFPVEVIYHGEDFTIDGKKKFNHATHFARFSKKHKSDDSEVDIDNDSNEEFRIEEIIVKKTVEFHTIGIKNSNEIQKLSGDFLIFLEGQDNVEKVIEELYKRDELQDCIILPAYSQLHKNDLQKIFLSIDELTELDEYKEYKGKIRRKIVVATNAAETGITIPGAQLVIDSLRAKILTLSPSGTETLTPTFISKAEATQRAGRTGRTCKGYCYRLCSEEGFTQLVDHVQSELERISIDGSILEFFSYGSATHKFDPKKILEIPEMRYLESMINLRKFGLIDDENNVTEIGKFVTQWPINIRMAVVIYHLRNQPELLNTFLIVVGMIEATSNGSIFYTPRKKLGQSKEMYKEIIDKHKEKFFSRFKGECDLDTFLKIHYAMSNETTYISSSMEEYKKLLGSLQDEERIMMTEHLSETKTSSNGKLSIKSCAKWAEMNSINNKVQKQAYNLYQRLFFKCESLNIQLVQSNYLTSSSTHLPQIRETIQKTLTRNIFHREERATRFKKWYVYCSEHHNGDYNINNRQSFCEVQEQLPECVIGMVISEVVTYNKDSGARRDLHFISAIFPITNDKIEENDSKNGKLKDSDE